MYVCVMVESVLEVLLPKIPVHPTEARSFPFPVELRASPWSLLLLHPKAASRCTSYGDSSCKLYVNQMEISESVVPTNARDMLGGFYIR